MTNIRYVENVQKKAFIKVQNLQYKFLDLKRPPALLLNFSESSSDLVAPPFPKYCMCHRHHPPPPHPLNPFQPQISPFRREQINPELVQEPLDQD